MNVPPIVPVTPKEQPAAPAAGPGVDAGGEDFASMIVTAEAGAAANDEGSRVETADADDAVAAAVAGEGTAPADPDPGAATQSFAIQSLIAEVRPQNGGAQPPKSEADLVAGIEAALTAPSAGTGDAKPAEPCTPTQAAAAAKPAKPGIAAPSSGKPAALDAVLADFSDPPQAQVTATATPFATNPAPAKTAATGDAALPETPASAANAAPVGTMAPGAPLAMPGTLSVETTLVESDIVTDAPKPEQRAAASGSGDAAKSNGASPPNAAATGGNPTPAAEPPGLVRSLASAQTTAGAETPADGTAQLPDAPQDTTAAKPAPSHAAATSQPAHAHAAMSHDTAAAFAGDLRHGVDSARALSADHAFRGPALQPAAEQVAVQITRAMQQSADRITVNLKPASLGSISVDLEIGPDHRLIAVISADRPETLDLMQRDARALERALNDAGIKTDSGSLSFNLRGDGNQHAAGQRTDGGIADWSSYAAPSDAVETPQMPVYARTLTAAGAIDIRV